MTKASVTARAKRVKLVLTDVDGCLTDNTLYYAPDGKGGVVENKGFSSLDGMAMRWAVAAGIPLGWISGRDSPATETRAKMLGVKYLYQNRLDKLGPFAEILADAKLTPGDVCYIGDDLPDAPIMLQAGLGVAVANAAPELKRAAHYVTKANGGYGAMREVVELILKSQGKWTPILKKYGLK